MGMTSGFQNGLPLFTLISASVALLLVGLLYDTVMRLVRLLVSICTSNSSSNDNCPVCGSFRSSVAFNGWLFSLRSTVQTCDDCSTKFTQSPSNRMAIALAIWALMVIACAATAAYHLSPALSDYEKLIARILIGVIAAYGGSIILERTVQFGRSRAKIRSQCK